MALGVGFALGRVSVPAPTKPVRNRASADAPLPSVAANKMAGPCKVTDVIDGDTLYAVCEGSGGDRVRLLRIDTPERQEAGYEEARDRLRELIGGQPVHLDFEVPGRPQRGDHGRLLAYVYVNGDNLNVEMVRNGWSRFWTVYGEGRFRKEFVAAENEARTHRRGLWAH